MRTIYFVRHGESVVNITHEFSYRYADYGLTAKGQLQANQTREYLKEIPFKTIFSSPLKRAMETAQIIAEPHRLPVIPVEALREVNVGTLELQPPTDENWRHFFEVTDAWKQGQKDRAFPGGDSFSTFLQRVHSGLMEILRHQNEGPILVITHGMFLLTLLNYYTDILTVSGPLNAMENCAVSVVKFLDLTCTPEQSNNSIRGQIKIIGSCRHLSGEAAKLVTGVPDLEK